MTNKLRRYSLDNLENKIFVKVPKEKISYLNKIIEAYNHLGLVSTIDAKEGKVVIHVTPDTRAAILEIIQQFPFIERVDD